MKLPLCVFSLLWAISVGAASPKTLDPAKDAELIQGNWTVTSIRQGGKELPKQDFAQLRFAITEKRLSFGAIGQDPMSLEYTLDSAKTPAAIDTAHQLDPGKPIVQLGVYSLEGDTLKLSLASAGMPRPRNFNEKTATTFVLTRVETSKKKPKSRSKSNTTYRGRFRGCRKWRG